MSTLAVPAAAAPSSETSKSSTSLIGESTSLAYVAAVFGTVLFSYGFALFFLR